ncbi:MAG: hypothetical protein JWO90_71, partial [Solirubrobacterales bacterium]|nr:hypothetical protein [Solirubrobacterales bacterium]
LTATAAVAVTALAAGAPAQASDAGLRKAVAAQERKVTVAANAFTEATVDTFSAVGRERATTARATLTPAVRRQRTAVTAAKATSARLVRLRTRYLDAVKGYQAGLRTFGQGLRAFDPDAPARSAALIRQAKAQMKAAQTRRLRAAKAIRG